MEGDDISEYNDCNLDPEEGMSSGPQTGLPHLAVGRERERKDSEKSVLRLPIPTPRRPPAAGTSSPAEKPQSTAPFDIIRKWRLTFSGGPDEDPEAFLSRLEDLRASSNLNDADLLRCLPVCLSDTVSLWYKNRGKFTSWRAFVREWRENFFDPDYQELLEHDLRVRKQGPDEPIRDYIACMEAMMNRLERPWPTTKGIRRIFWNARKELRNAISIDSSTTMKELERKLREAESNVSPGNADYYRSPYLANRYFAYNSAKNKKDQKNLSREKQHKFREYESANAVAEWYDSSDEEECDRESSECRGQGPRSNDRK